MKRFLIFLFLPLLSWAQFQFIPINANYASFYDTDSTAFVQVYLSLYQGNLSYQPDKDSLFVASFSTTLTVMQDEEIIKDISHSYRNSTRDTSRISHFNHFVDVFSIELPYGNYKAVLQMIDNTSLQKGEYVLELKTIQPQDTVFLSDIEFCESIKPDTAKTMFYKNGLQVVPNPGSIYDILRPMLYYYIELNNLSFSPNEKRYYDFEYVITNAEGDTVKQKKKLQKFIKGPTLVEVGGMNVMSLPSDIYFLTATVKDRHSQKQSSVRRKFMVYKPKKKGERQQQQNQLPAIAEVYGTFTEQDLEEEFAAAKYLATRKEREIFKNLHKAEPMKKFLTDFWRRRDRIGNVADGENRREFLKRLSYVNQHFSRLRKQGWKTDRGRVYITYGPPDEYERHTSSMGMLPYVIWHYHNLEGGAIFVFVDREGFGEYELVHSTYRKELQNPNWKNMIGRKTGTDFLNQGQEYR